MSRSLYRSFSDLTINASTPALIAIDIPAEASDGPKMYYGSDIDHDRLAEYGRNLYGECHPGFDETSYAIIALSDIKRRTGIKSLEFQPVLLHPNAPPDTTFLIAESGVKVALIISVCSSKRRSFRRRPTQARMDHLAQILGNRQPMWWTTSYS